MFSSEEAVRRVVFGATEAEEAWERRRMEREEALTRRNRFRVQPRPLGAMPARRCCPCRETCLRLHLRRRQVDLRQVRGSASRAAHE